jgi:uncharacterized phosphosugar-binding protein
MESLVTGSSAVDDYLAGLAGLLVRLRGEHGAAIDRAGAMVARSLAADGLLRVFGSGHSHMLAEELFYRAGGLAAVDPILIDRLMLHVAAVESTTLERTPGLGLELYDTLGVGENDVFLLITNSGGNAVAIDLATRARDNGIPVIAIISTRHAHSGSALRGGVSALEELADVVIDNLGEPGDASVALTGLEQRMGPTSSVLGAAIVNGIALSAASHLLNAGAVPDVFSSSNMAGGDAANAALIERFQGRVRAL